ncbi:hypothetical protein EVAR_11123_1 [Eumeta japonica]|uniref:Uncharacterized protein n=1 Tax=Eumeta variegata TaxID=151549 RepID=A0A4C1U442_EUMVA|nr:hypothetical protein EVAR_11123_1 [Eumeta japonica]
MSFSEHAVRPTASTSGTLMSSLATRIVQKLSYLESDGRRNSGLGRGRYWNGERQLHGGGAAAAGQGGGRGERRGRKLQSGESTKADDCETELRYFDIRTWYSLWQ